MNLKVQTAAPVEPCHQELVLPVGQHALSGPRVPRNTLAGPSTHAPPPGRALLYPGMDYALGKRLLGETGLRPGYGDFKKG